jgi:hypothetical protein
MRPGPGVPLTPSSLCWLRFEAAAPGSQLRPENSSPVRDFTENMGSFVVIFGDFDQIKMVITSDS